jgi:hypothetical protein
LHLFQGLRCDPFLGSYLCLQSVVIDLLLRLCFGKSRPALVLLIFLKLLLFAFASHQLALIAFFLLSSDNTGVFLSFTATLNQ